MRNSLFLPQLLALFPGAQFIHILRDGRDVVASYLAKDIIPSVGKACAYWRENVTHIRQFGRQLNRQQFHEIRYEDLVQAPETMLRSVCAFLGLDFRPTMLRHWQRIAALGDADRPLHSNLARPINRRAVGKWRQTLTPPERAFVQTTLSDTLAAFGYGQMARRATHNANQGASPQASAP